MKTVSIKNSVAILFFSIIFLGCSKKIDTPSQENSKNGFYVTYPFIEKKVIFIKNEKMKFEMEKILTQNSINYNVGFENQKLYPIPFNRDFSDYEPTFNDQLNILIEKEYCQTPDSSFIIKYEYGTGHIEWNYLYKIKQNKIYLDKLFFIEKYASKNDTVAYVSKATINKLISVLNIKTIKDSMTKIENRKTKDYRFILNKK